MSDDRTVYTDPNRTVPPADPNRTVPYSEPPRAAYTEPTRQTGALPMGRPMGARATFGAAFDSMDMAAGAAWAVMNLGPLVAAAIIGH